MASSSLESKTVRPGNLGAYSYYHSARRPDHRPKQGYIAVPRRRLVPWKLVVAVVLVAAVAGIPYLNGGGTPADQSKSTPSSETAKSAPSKAPKAAPAATAAPIKKDACAGNSLNKLVLVDISARHLWACAGGKTALDAPVITGMNAHASTVTPSGTYQVYGKQTDTVLAGADEAGSWNRPVSYWMPFLSNQHGIYGFHDATWRPNSDFGNVSPDSSDASHGCVELPLAAQAWLYKWAPVGTTVKIRN